MPVFKSPSIGFCALTAAHFPALVAPGTEPSFSEGGFELTASTQMLWQSLRNACTQCGGGSVPQPRRCSCQHFQAHGSQSHVTVTVVQRHGCQCVLLVVVAWWRGCCWLRPRWCWLSARALAACPTGGLADRDIADVLNHACDPTRTSQSAAAPRQELEDGVAIALCGTGAEPRPSMPSLLRRVRRVLRCRAQPATRHAVLCRTCTQLLHLRPSSTGVALSWSHHDAGSIALFYITST